MDLNYELTDHLGNVCAVVTGRLLDGNGGGTPKQAELLSAQGYEAFGSLLPGRNNSSGLYRFGFNGMEKDDEMYGSTGTSYNFGERIQDPRVGRFFSLDPISAKNPTFSPYAFADDNPVLFIDHEGLFRMTKRMQRIYPQLTNVLKNIQQTVHSDPQTYTAFKETMGLTDAQANKMLRWGKGPKVNVRDIEDYAETGMNVFFGYGKMTLNKDMVEAVESGGTWRGATSTSKGSLFALYATVLHEAQHNAENKKFGFLNLVKPYDPLDDDSEKGRVFERKAFGAVVEGRGHRSPDRKALEWESRQGGGQPSLENQLLGGSQKSGAEPGSHLPMILGSERESSKP